jgi:hypothetical protein
MRDEGTTDGETTDVDDRTFVWDAATGSWRPTDPGPFELVEGRGGTGWYWDPVERVWSSDAEPVDVTYEGPSIALRSIVLDSDLDHGSS